MEKRRSWGFKAILAVLLLAAWLLPCAAAMAASTSVADPKTFNDWKTLFGSSSEPTTQHAGDIWVDKSVFTKSEVDDQFGTAIQNKIGQDQFGNENFLVTLSTIGSNSEINGFATVPTDTMIVLDLSCSMYGNGSTSMPATTVQKMVDAVNESITKLQSLNEYNRVGVIAYYGGNGRNDNASTTANHFYTFLKLDRYTTSSTNSQGVGQYMSVTTDNRNRLQSIRVNNGVTNSAGQSAATTYNPPAIASTYMQLGIIKAMDEFLEADTKIPADAGFQAGQERIPIMLLMSDGEPTAASTNFSSPGTSEMGNNYPSDRNPNQTDFVTQLSAAYAKYMIDVHYASTTPLFYTLSLGDSISLAVMDPKNNTNSTIAGYWDSLAQNRSVTMSIGNRRLTVSEKTPGANDDAGTAAFPSRTAYVNQRNYVDKMYTADTADDMAQAFGDIVTEIELQSRYYGTHIAHGNIHEDGYVEFTDEIGGFMEVKEMLGLYVNGTLYNGAMFANAVLNDVFGSSNTLNETGRAVVEALSRRMNVNETQLFELLNNAVSHGQIAYESASDFSNYIGWYADANNAYIAPYSPSSTAPANAAFAVRSYVYMGRASDLTHGDSDWFYALVRVRRNLATGRDIVDFKLPASLMPLITYEITVKDNSTEITQASIDSLTSDAAGKTPVSLLYEVGLSDEVKAHTLASNLKYLEDRNVLYPANSDGTYSFYTNRWRDKDANTFVPNTNPAANIFADGNSVTTVSRLVPSTHNELYYFVWDTVVVDEDGDPITGSTKPTKGYYKHTYVEIDNGALKVTTHQDEIHKDSLAKAVRQDNQWVIPAGTPKRNLERHWTTTKSANTTNTLAYADHPVVMNPTEGEGLYETYIYEGNNGKVTVTPAQGLMITKALDGVSTDPNAVEEFTFEIAFGGSFGPGTYNWVKVDANGTETSGSQIVGANDPMGAQVTLKPGEAFYILGLPTGTTYTVTEKHNHHYRQQSATNASGEIDALTISHAHFVNEPSYYGELLVTKDVTHPFPNLPDNLANMGFDVTITLTGTDADLAALEDGTPGTPVSGGVQFKVELKDDTSVKVMNIPNGVAYEVAELSLSNGFSLTTTALSGNITANTVSTVALVNNYAPNAVAPKIKVQGTKTLANMQSGSTRPTFKVMLQQVQVGGTGNTAIGEPFEVAIQWDSTDPETGAYEFDFSKLGANNSPLTFSNVGEYTYAVYEQIPSDTQGIVYDRSYALFTVHVTDGNLDGQLEAKVVVHNNTADQNLSNGTMIVNKNFRNVYDAARVSIPVQKTINGGTDHAHDSGILFGLFEAAANGGVPAIAEDATAAFTALSDADGKLEFVIPVTYNEYKTAKTYYLRERKPPLNLSVPGMTYDTAWKYSVTIEWRNNANGTAEDSPTVTITDLADNTTVTPTADNPLLINNTFAEQSVGVTLSGKKTLNGRELKAGEFVFGVYQTDETFQVTDYDDPGSFVTHDANGNYAFAPISFTKDGTYYLLVREIPNRKIENGSLVASDLGGVHYSEEQYHVTVNVVRVMNNNEVVLSLKEDDGGYVHVTEVSNNISYKTDALNFTNRYAVSDEKSVTIEGTKKLTGRAMLPDEFTFQLFRANANFEATEQQAMLTATNDLDGSFAFEEIVYTEPGTFYYVVKEENGGRDEIEYDKAQFGVEVVVTDDGNGRLNLTKTYYAGNSAVPQISFTNEYTAKDVMFVVGGEKFLSGRALVDGEFGFDLYETDNTFEVTGAPLVSTTNNQGKYAFVLSYTSEDLAEKGTHRYYVIRERVDNAIENVFFDRKDYRISVTVFDDGLGQIRAIVQCDENGGQANVPADQLHFYNAFKPSGLTLELKGTKELNGKLLEDKEFSFELYRANEKFDLLGVPVETAANDERGNFAFSNGFVITEPGASYFVVMEKVGDTPKMVYDETTYYVTANAVADPTTGELSLSGKPQIVVAQTGKAASEIKFINHYYPDVNLPETGDASNLAALAMLALTSGGAAIVLSRKRKR